MRRIFLIIPALLILATLAIPAHAEVRNLDPVSDPLGVCSDDMSPDQCMGTGTTTLICSDSYGCPQCAMNQSLTAAVCYRLYGLWGYCSCTAKGTYVDKYGQVMPRCAAS